MRVYKTGKDRFKEMFEKVNKVSLNESFDSPKDKDEKYLDNAVGQDEDQVSKYDDGVRYPVEPELKTKDDSLEGLKGDDAPLDEDEKKKSELSDDIPISSKYIVLRDDYGKYHDIEIPENQYEDHLDKLYRHFGTNSQYQEVSFDPQKQYKLSNEILDESTTPEEDQLLDPSTHWVDHYTPKNVSENGLNFPHPIADPEAGEQEWEEFEKWKRGELDDDEMEDAMQDVNELDIPKDMVKSGARIPIKDISPETFPLQQHLPSYDTADAQQLMNRTGDIMRWKANFTKRFGDQGDVVKSDAWWWNVEGNPKYEDWKNRGITAKANFLDRERKAGRNKFLDTYDPMNESDNPELGQIQYDYDQKGNWIPRGYEDKKIALRKVEQPIGSGNWKVAVVQLDDAGELDYFIDTKNSWQEAKAALHSSIT